MDKTIGVVIVTYNSERHLSKCIEALDANLLRPSYMVIVDNGSASLDYLTYKSQFSKQEIIIADTNLGYAAANNVGFSYLCDKVDYVLFLNPDLFCAPDTLIRAYEYMEKKSAKDVGIITGKLLGYDLLKGIPTGLIDSSGIFYTSYGRFYDRGHGISDSSNNYNLNEEVPAACGAFLFCRVDAIKNILINRTQVFDEAFFMYKEDIDLSLRMRNKGYRVMFVANIIAYHCRGWADKREQVPYWARRQSLMNDWRLWKKQYLPLVQQFKFLLYLVLKTIYVYGFERINNMER